MLLDLVKNLGLDPKKVSSTGGGEWHAACPKCGGKDRFILQPFWKDKGRYLCRKCEVKGDTIQFCRNFLGMTFQEARDKITSEINLVKSLPQLIHLETIHNPTFLWKSKAQQFVESCHKRLLIDPNALNYVKARGLSIETIQKHQIGWNCMQAFQRRSDWELEESENRLWLCLPKGTVIPIFHENSIYKVRIRRTEWKEGDQYGKYYELPGSAKIMPIFGNSNCTVTILLESEFDAMLIAQETKDLCSCIALTGAQKKPDAFTYKWLQERDLILYSLDCDDAGKKEYSYWRSTFPNVRPWQSNSRKSPADSYTLDGVNLRNWIEEGMRYWKNKM